MIAPRTFALILAIGLLAARAVNAQPLPSPPPMLADAELTSVCFVDADHGWAVGDRGVIWATSDGGRHWQLQQSPVACRLECVQFLDTLHGWAVGGYTHPVTHHTSGVMLRTRDGGRTWEPTADRTLPALKHVKFQDARRGWIAGDPSPLYASGIFRTDTGGQEWTAVPRGNSLGWSAADFLDDKRGVLAGRDGQVAVTTAVEVQPTRMANLGPRPLRRLVMADPQTGWLVGDGGQILTTRDSGFTWEPPQTLPAGAADFDYLALAAHGTHCWIAGNPGTRVLYSGDGGQSWETFATGQHGPILGLSFLDASRGWAVGSLGAILATRDGGRTWRPQRSGGIRAALLGIFSESARVPLEVIAQQSGSEGFLGAVEIVCRTDDDVQADRRSLTLAERAQEAVVAAGGSHASAAWQFPISPLALTPQVIMDGWNRANEGKAAARLEEHIVRRIRTWRPEVIVTESVSPRDADPLSHLVSQMVLAAAEKAAEPGAYPQQFAHQGLEPWKVKKIFSVQSDARQGTVNVAPSQWSAGLGRSLAEVAEAARSILADDAPPAPVSVGLSLLVDHLPQNTGRRDVFSGIVLLAGGEARRQPLDPPTGNLDQLARAAQKRHNVQQLLSRVGTGPAQGAAMLAQTGELLEGISDRGAGEILFQLARRYHECGLPDAAAETMELLLTRYPQHPLADAAALWLVQFYSSGEMAWRMRKHTATVVRAGGHNDPSTGASPVVRASAEATPDAPMSGASSASHSAAERAARALAVGRLIERSRPMLFADPAFRVPLLTALRTQGEAKQAEMFFASLAKNAGNDPWGDCAIAEQCLQQGRGEPPKIIVTCVAVKQRPKLDGRLDDEPWQMGKLVPMTSAHAGDENAADVVLARDDEFLYVAVSCQKVAGGNYEPDAAKRTYDADLSSRDRVEFHLDIDRDYTSFWTLAVDCRGFTSDRVLGDATWNPAWYVASGGDDQFWTAEIAVPLTQLTSTTPKAGDHWAIGIQRLIPNVGLQSATRPAAVSVRPEGFGLLRFE